MKKIIFNISLILFAFNFSHAQNCIDVDYKIRGYFHAGSSQKDKDAPGGFYEDKNTPKPVKKLINDISDDNEFQILVKKDSSSIFNKNITGFKVFVINRTNSIQQLPAQDSRLYLKRQVFYKGKWQDIEYLPSSWCGNSYHTVFINPNQYWDFTAPCIKGKTKAKFRF